MNDDEQIVAQCEYLLSNMQYERKWGESKFSPKEARLTLKKMIARSKHI